MNLPATFGDCAECKRLLADSSRSIETHLRIIGKIQALALESNGTGAAARLGRALREARKERERAVGKYQDHIASHQIRAAGSGSF